MRWLMLALILAAFVWVVSWALRRRAGQRNKDKATVREGLDLANETSLRQSTQQQLGD
jgi:hypothetical protein